MKRVQILAGIGLALLAAAVLVLASRNRRPPELPADAIHTDYRGADACLTCHGPAGEHPQPENHPAIRECMRCHARPR